MDTTDLLRCPVCGGTAGFVRVVEPRIWIDEAYFAPLRGRIHVSACGGCGLHAVTPRPDDAALSGFYSKDGYGCHTVEGGSDPGLTLDLAPPAAEAGRASAWLDIGCGAGALIRAARDRGFDARGVEVGDLARRRLTQEGLSVYPDLAACRDSGFRPDVVSMITVLEHIADPGRMLDEIRDLIAPGGHLIVIVPNLKSLRARVGRLLPVDRFPNSQLHTAFPIHLVYYTRRHLQRLLEGHGFELCSSGAFGFGLEVFDRPGSSPKAFQAQAAAPVQRNAISRVVRSAAKRILSMTHTGEDLWMVARAGRSPRRG